VCSAPDTYPCFLEPPRSQGQRPSGPVGCPPIRPGQGWPSPYFAAVEGQCLNRASAERVAWSGFAECQRTGRVLAQSSAEDFRFGECKHLFALSWAVVLTQIQSHLADPKAAGAPPRRMETGCTPLWRACRQHFADSSCKPAARCSQIGDQDVLDFLRVHTGLPTAVFPKHSIQC